MSAEEKIKLQRALKDLNNAIDGLNAYRQSPNPVIVSICDDTLRSLTAAQQQLEALQRAE
jgi:hypothetical protein